MTGDRDEQAEAHGPVLVDVDGDGRPDAVTPRPRPAPRWSPVRGRHEPAGPVAVLEDQPAAGEVSTLDRTPPGTVLEDRPADLPGSHGPGPWDDEDHAGADMDRRASNGGRVFAHAVARRDAVLKPVIPAVLRSRADFEALVLVLGRFYGHVALFHLVRIPAHVWGRLWRAPRGLYRVEVRFARWTFDANALRMEALAVIREAQDDFRENRKANRSPSRIWPWLAAHGTLAGGCVYWWWFAGLLTQAGTAAAVVLVLARLGTDPDKPIVSTAGTPLQAPKLAPDMVTAALLSLGIAAIDKTTAKGYVGPGITYPGIAHREGPGWRLDVDLPLGVTAKAVISKREELASGLRRRIGCVWPEADPQQHAGRLILWVGDKPFSEQKQPPWPLAKDGPADLFRPIPVGWDQRGRLVSAPLMYTNWLIGAIPGAGKTGWAKVLTFAAALDPYAELHCHELKGTGDYAPIKAVCHRYTSSPPDDASLRNVMASLREVHGYLAERGRTIGMLPEDLVGPERKVTPALAARRELRLHPVVLTIDEIQELFDSEFGAEAERLIKAIEKRGRALAIILIMATQRPDRESLPKAISANAGTRVCLRVTGQPENDMILGTSAYKAGMRATILDDTDLGVGLLKTGATARIVRAAELSARLVKSIGRRALEMRTAAGTLTGDAAGQAWEPDVTVTVDYVADVRGVFREGETALQNEEILARLQTALQAGHYEGWEPAQLTGVLKANGVEAAGKQVKRNGVNRRGVRLEDLLAVLDDIDDVEEGEPEELDAGERPAIEADDIDDEDDVFLGELAAEPAGSAVADDGDPRA